MSYATSLPAATTGRGNVPVSTSCSFAQNNYPLEHENEREEHRRVFQIYGVNPIRSLQAPRPRFWIAALKRAYITYRLSGLFSFPTQFFEETFRSEVKRLEIDSRGVKILVAGTYVKHGNIR